MSITASDLDPEAIRPLRDAGYTINTLEDALQAVRQALGLRGQQALIYLTGVSDLEELRP